MLRQMRNALDTGSAGTNDSNSFVLQFGERCTFGVAASIIVIPSARMKSMTFKIGQARNTR